MRFLRLQIERANAQMLWLWKRFVRCAHNLRQPVPGSRSIGLSMCGLSCVICLDESGGIENNFRGARKSRCVNICMESVSQITTVIVETITNRIKQRHPILNGRVFLFLLYSIPSCNTGYTSVAALYVLLWIFCTNNRLWLSMGVFVGFGIVRLIVSVKALPTDCQNSQSDIMSTAARLSRRKIANRFLLLIGVYPLLAKSYIKIRQSHNVQL